LKSSIFDAAVVGLWLSGIFGSRFVWNIFLGQQTFPIYIAVITIVWPLAYFLIAGTRILPSGLTFIDIILFSLFSFFAVVSCFFSSTPVYSLGYFLITLAGVYLALLINTYLNDEVITQSIKIYYYLTAACLFYLLFIELSAPRSLRLGRETDILNPNSIAMIAMSIVVCSLAFKNVFIIALGQLAGIATIYFTGSRAAALGGLAAISIGIYRRVRLFNRASQVAVIVAITLAMPLILYFYSGFFFTTADKFFLWSDPHRGIDSGMSGRLYTWIKTAELIRDNWIFGVGFRAHESYIAASSAHNGYLATMAEIGIIGFGAIITFILRRQFRLFASWRFDTSVVVLNVLFPLSIGYLLIAIFERYLINIGNPVSLLFLVALMRPIVRRQSNRKTELKNDIPATK
jgi:O-antigen ligase